MPTITKNRLPQVRQFAAPYGNLFSDVFRYQTNATGAVVDSDVATAVQVNDVVRIGILPAGLVIHDAMAIVSDAFAASTTADVGFEYVDGVDSTDVPQDADYFFAAQSTASTARARMSTVNAPVRLPKDAYLIVTRKGAADSAVGIMDVVVTGIQDGSA